MVSSRDHWHSDGLSSGRKILIPETEDDLRPISLTDFYSKVTEHFVVMWLLEYIGDQIDVRQFGGSKDSITHYIIVFLNFILSNQEDSAPTAILACMVDFMLSWSPN